MKQRTAFFLSDRTGITAETLGHSLISQFEHIDFTQITLPFVDSIDKAHEAKDRINKARANDNCRPIAFATIVNPEIRDIIMGADAFFLDFFKTFIPPLERELELTSSNQIGRIHGMKDLDTYNTRIEAVNFALNYDDGAKTHDYDDVDVILIGVSRSGKTPTSLYLAMQFGLRVANYPLAEQDIESEQLPVWLKKYKKKIFGLTIDPVRLQAIRQGRRPNSQYSDLKQCQREVQRVETMFQMENIPFLNATHLSIEELATRLLVITGIERRLR